MKNIIIRHNIARLIRKAEELEFEKRSFLTMNGWKYSSNYPDCIWRWSRHIIDKRGNVIAFVTGNTDEALQMFLFDKGD